MKINLRLAVKSAFVFLIFLFASCTNEEGTTSTDDSGSEEQTEVRADYKDDETSDIAVDDLPPRHKYMVNTMMITAEQADDIRKAEQRFAVKRKEMRTAGTWDDREMRSEAREEFSEDITSILGPRGWRQYREFEARWKKLKDQEKTNE